MEGWQRFAKNSQSLGRGGRMIKVLEQMDSELEIGVAWTGFGLCRGGVFGLPHRATPHQGQNKIWSATEYEKYQLMG